MASHEPSFNDDQTPQQLIFIIKLNCQEGITVRVTVSLFKLAMPENCKFTIVSALPFNLINVYSKFRITS